MDGVNTVPEDTKSRPINDFASSAVRRNTSCNWGVGALPLLEKLKEIKICYYE